MSRQVRIVTPEDGVTNGTKIIDVATGIEIVGVEAVRIDLRPNDVVRATISVGMAAFDGKVEAMFSLRDITKETSGRIIKAIEFADGERVEF